MPNRIIKESICTSPNLDNLSPNAEILFYRLIVNCDDYGRFEYKDKIIRSRCFPLKIDKITDKDIAIWLKEIQAAQLVKLYAVDGRTFLQINTWENHQQIRAKRSKYPSPNGNIDSTCNHMIADANICPRNPIRIQSESNPNPNTIYVLWNEQKIIVHKKLTDDIERAIITALKDNTLDDIVNAIKNYAMILKGDEYYFKYSWTLKDFLKRGLTKFIDKDICHKNYLGEKNNGAGKFGSKKNNSRTIPKPEDYPDPKDW